MLDYHRARGAEATILVTKVGRRARIYSTPYPSSTFRTARQTTALTKQCLQFMWQQLIQPGAEEKGRLLRLQAPAAQSCYHRCHGCNKPTSARATWEMSWTCRTRHVLLCLSSVDAKSACGHRSLHWCQMLGSLHLLMYLWCCYVLLCRLMIHPSMVC